MQLSSILDFIWANRPRPSDLLWVPLAGLYAWLALAFAGRLKHQNGWRAGYTRKVFHFLIFGAAAVTQVVAGVRMVCVLGGCTTLVLAYALYRGNGHPMYEALAREKDAPRRTHYIVVPYVATLIGGITINVYFAGGAIVGYLCAGIGDAIAEPVGTRWGKHPYRAWTLTGIAANRTLEGSAAVFVGSTLAILLAWAAVGTIPTTWYWALPLALAATAIEAISPHGWDNLSMQVLPAWLATLFWL